MRWDEISQQVEPEQGSLRQHPALAGNATAENAIEGGNSVRRYEQQRVAQVIDIADFATPQQRGLKLCFDQYRIVAHEFYPTFEYHREQHFPGEPSGLRRT